MVTHLHHYHEHGYSHLHWFLRAYFSERHCDGVVIYTRMSSAFCYVQGMDNGRFGNDVMSRWLFGSSDEIPRKVHVIERARGLESINDNFNCHVLNCSYL